MRADGQLDLARLPELMGSRCRLLALTHCSNVTGARTDVAAVVAAARQAGARVLLDGAQAVQHGPQDVRALGVDFYAFSGHKCFGPGGIGVLWGRHELLAAMPPFLGGGGMIGEVTPALSTWAPPPQRFEAGTPPIAQAIGLAAALEWMLGLPWPQIHAREDRLCRQLIEGLRAIPELRLLGPDAAVSRAPIVSFEMPGLHPHDICQVLDTHGLALRGGHHCAQPLLAALGVESLQPCQHRALQRRGGYRGPAVGARRGAAGTDMSARRLALPGCDQAVRPGRARSRATGAGGGRSQAGQPAVRRPRAHAGGTCRRHDQRRRA